MLIDKKIELLKEVLGINVLLEDLISSLSIDELEDHINYIMRMRDVKIEGDDE